MKLETAIVIGKAAGDKTIGQCVTTVYTEAISIFSYDNMDRELYELQDALDTSGIPPETPIAEAEEIISKAKQALTGKCDNV